MSKQLEQNTIIVIIICPLELLCWEEASSDNTASGDAHVVLLNSLPSKTLWISQ